ncbi:MAG TPA: acyltransferase family protein [Telluria sp.]
MSDNAKHARADIQALRGLAVLLVVLYHAKIGGLAAGYLGVDIFFVISGYLITQLVGSGILRGDFSFREFYFRRAKRLLPAAYATFALTAVLAPWFLNQEELRDFGTQLAGAVTFTGNFVLWQQTGYFEGTSDLKPLLHVWSLAIEEQYYFLLPAALLMVRPSRWISGAVVLIILSLGLCILGGIVKPVATFYLLPTRAWELLIGSLGALWTLRASANGQKPTAAPGRPVLLLSLACLLLLPFFPLDGAHPGWNAFLVCAATLMVILCNSPWLNAAHAVRPLARIGDFSYSLYLVHWPVIAFVRNSWVGSGAEVPLYLRLATVVLSFIAAFLLYRFIEDPVRKSNFALSTPLVGKTVLTSVLLVSIIPLTMSFVPQHVDYSMIRRTNFGFSEACEYTTAFRSRPECRSSATPDLLVWGDSYAMHLVPGLLGEWQGGGVIQATMSQCGPFLGLAPKNLVKPEAGMYKTRAWAESCIAFNQSVMDFLRSAPSIRIVVLSSPFSQYVTRENQEFVVAGDSQPASRPVTAAAALAGLHRTVSGIRSLGKSVVLVAPPPSSDFNVGGCLERHLSGAFVLGGRPGCLISRAEYLAKRADVLSFIRSAESDADIPVIRFDPWLCDALSCKTMLDGTMVYRDGGHFSYAGSRLMAARMQLARLIQEKAK